jgi:hypothetical protein
MYGAEKAERIREIRTAQLRIEYQFAALRVLLAADILKRSLNIETRYNHYHDEAGRFTNADGVGSGTGSRRDGRVRVAQAGPVVIPNRATITARFPNATPAQEARLAVSDILARGEIAETQARVPGYRVQPSFTEGIEGEIARNEADAQEARDARYRYESESLSGGAGPGPGSTQRTMNDVCVPGGTVVGTKRGSAGHDATTMKPAGFERLLRDLRNGALEITPSPTYRGLWYRRSDNTIFGARMSDKHGLTLDIIDSSGNPQLRPGKRIHYGY